MWRSSDRAHVQDCTRAADRHRTLGVGAAQRGDRLADQGRACERTFFDGSIKVLGVGGFFHLRCW